MLAINSFFKINLLRLLLFIIFINVFDSLETGKVASAWCHICGYMAVSHLQEWEVGAGRAAEYAERLKRRLGSKPLSLGAWAPLNFLRTSPCVALRRPTTGDRQLSSLNASGCAYSELMLLCAHGFIVELDLL